jgi:hypothetical protein
MDLWQQSKSKSVVASRQLGQFYAARKYVNQKPNGHPLTDPGQKKSKTPIVADNRRYRPVRLTNES